MPKRTKRVPELKPPTTEPGGPVAYRAEACRLADDSWLPQTVFYVADRECAWFQVGNAITWPDYAERQGWRLCPMITLLPARYFVR